MIPSSFGPYSVQSELPALRPEVRRFAAVQAGLGRQVEVRLFATAVGEASRADLRFRSECAALLAMDHSAILKVLDVGVVEGHLYYVTDLRQASSLQELLEATSGPLEAAQAFRMAIEISSGLAHLHAQGLLLRRLDSRSVFLNPETGHFYLADYALVKRLGGASLTEAGVPCPEGVQPVPEGRILGDLDQRSDLFLLGATLYHAFTGHDPWPQLAAAIKSHSESDLLPASAHRPELPQALDQTLAAAMDFLPERRPAAASELADRLEKARDALRVREAVDATLASGVRQPLPSRVAARSRSPRETPASVPEVRNPARVAVPLLLAVMAAGVVWKLAVPAPPPEPSAGGRAARSLLKPAARGAVTREQFLSMSGEVLRKATGTDNFLRRWEVAHRYLASQPRSAAATASGDPVVKLLSLRFEYSRSPRTACESFDTVVGAQARLLVAGEP